MREQGPRVQTLADQINPMILRGLIERETVVRHVPAVVIAFDSNRWSIIEVFKSPLSVGRKISLSNREILLFSTPEAVGHALSRLLPLKLV